MNLFRLTKLSTPGFTLDTSSVTDVLHMLDAYVCDECQDDAEEYLTLESTDLMRCEEMLKTQCGAEFVFEHYKSVI